MFINDILFKLHIIIITKMYHFTEVIIDAYVCSCGSVVRALCQQRKRLWVQFPGNTYTDEKMYNLNALWIKESAKCININACEI